MTFKTDNYIPTFSIITVCLNAGDLLNKTIQSVLDQTFNDYEIIIKDGLSSDSSISNIPNDSRIKTIIKKDQGIYDAMNQSLEFVNGKFLVFLNAGDLLYDGSVLQKMNESLLNYQETGLLYCDYITTDLKKRVNSPHKLYKFTLFRNMLCHQCCFFNAEQFRKTGLFDLNYKVVSDYDFLLRFLLKNKNSSHHVDLLGANYLSGGFSFVSRDKINNEVNIIRKKYFGVKYYYFRFVLQLTLPKFRKMIYYSNNKFLKKILLSTSNLANKL